MLWNCVSRCLLIIEILFFSTLICFWDNNYNFYLSYGGRVELSQIMKDVSRFGNIFKFQKHGTENMYARKKNKLVSNYQGSVKSPFRSTQCWRLLEKTCKNDVLLLVLSSSPVFLLFLEIKKHKFNFWQHPTNKNLIAYGRAS